MTRNLKEGYKASSKVSFKTLHILQVSTADISGGAEKVAWNLFQIYRQRGLSSWLAVGYKYSDDPDVLLNTTKSNHYNPWTRFWLAFANKASTIVGRIRGAGRLQRWLRWIGQPQWLLDAIRGYEDFNFPGSWKILDLPPECPDILHCHNLHGGYFDLRVLPWLSQQVPTILTLHDAWLLSGHCAHSFDCERWKTGCGNCPDLTIYPSIRRDATAYNWRRKRDIYAKNRLYVATPSHWLMRKVEQSILAPAIVEARVIPNGVDLTVFHPGDQQEARKKVKIAKDSKMLLFASNGIRKNPWRDYQTLRAAITLVAEQLKGQHVLFIALGEDSPPERIGLAEVRFIPYQKDPETMACYYQAADVYMHAAKVDTFPNVILEALACGTPVVATAVGGIPEQVEDNVTGFLVPPGDARAMAKAVVKLLTDDTLWTRFGRNATEEAQKPFDLNRQVNEYISWYQEILEKNSHQLFLP